MGRKDHIVQQKGRRGKTLRGNETRNYVADLNHLRIWKGQSTLAFNVGGVRGKNLCKERKANRGGRKAKELKTDSKINVKKKNAITGKKVYMGGFEEYLHAKVLRKGGDYTEKQKGQGGFLGGGRKRTSPEVGKNLTSRR